LLKFRRLLEDNKLGEALFAQVGQVLQALGLNGGPGTIVDATILAPTELYRECRQGARPRDAPEAQKPTVVLGMKLHIGVDNQPGLTHGAMVTKANVHDKHPLPDLLHGQEQRVYGESAYASQKELIVSKAPQAKDFTNQKRVRKGGTIDEVDGGKNRNKSRIRA